MEWLVPLAAKSFLVAGGALLLLRLLRNRSAADRSWIAHLALAGLLLLPVAIVALPKFDVAGPEFLVGKAEVASPSSASPVEAAPAPAASPVPVADVPSAGGAAIDWPFWGYAVPAALLLLLTLMALIRLFVLKARASVLVDAPWLTALARAQKRMGFKHGTALLTSNELPSPISWGVVRPVILLNAEATESHEEAEAIITHELAHVAHFDWAKLLLARVAIAIFWFNPFVWLLAREAHQLREEAADDAVLATDIEDHPENQTRFVMVGRGPVPPPTGHDKTTVVVFQRADKAGSLLAILQEFAARAISLTKLESRPTKKALGDYCFIIDLEGHLADEIVADCLRDIRSKVADIKFLGSYPAAGEHGPTRRRDAEEAWRQADDWLRTQRAKLTD